MAEAQVERRLAAILTTDTVGYSGMIGQDEAGTCSSNASSIIPRLIAATEPTVPDIGHSAELFYFRSGSPSDLVFRGGYNG
jgi:hypothetical protein